MSCRLVRMGPGWYTNTRCLGTVCRTDRKEVPSWLTCLISRTGPMLLLGRCLRGVGTPVSSRGVSPDRPAQSPLRPVHGTSDVDPPACKDRRCQDRCWHGGT